tara:strand:+ start:673 stop:1185 length:513 start_codon:yes stop_codon:yes gene_type:complete
MTTLNDIELKAKEHRAHRDQLSAAITKMEAELGKLRERHMEKIRPLITTTVTSAEELFDMVEGAPSLFAKPKSQTLHSIKLGFQKQRGSISVPDSDKTIALIRKHLPERAAELIQVTEAPKKKSLNDLSVADLKKIGCTVTDDTDVAFIKPVSGDAEKLVDALLKDAEAA